MDLVALGLGLALLAPPDESEPATRAPAITAPAEANQEPPLSAPADPAASEPSQAPEENTASTLSPPPAMPEATVEEGAEPVPATTPVEPTPEQLAKRQRVAKAMMGTGGSLLGIGVLTLAFGLPSTISDYGGGLGPVLGIGAAGLIVGSIFLADGVKRQRQLGAPLSAEEVEEHELAAQPAHKWEARRRAGKFLVGFGIGGLAATAGLGVSTAVACSGGCGGSLAELGYILTPAAGVVSLALLIPGAVLWSSANKQLRAPALTVVPAVSPSLTGLSLLGRF